MVNFNHPGVKLVEVMVDRNISISFLSQQINTNPEIILDLIKCKISPNDILEKISLFFKIPVEYWFQNN